MATRTQKVKLGVFLTAAIVLFAGTVIVLTGMGLWEDRWTYFIEFRESVSGLEQGAPVKLRGVRVGTVDAIRVDPKNVEVVEVRIQVDEGTPIKTDTEAFINMQGITGLKFIELAGGTAESNLLPPGSEIQAGQSLLEQITGRATDIGLKVEKLLNNALYMTRERNQERVDEIITNTEETTEHLAQLTNELTLTLQTTRSLVVENREGLDQLIANSNQALTEINTLTDLAQRVVRDSKIPQTVAEFRQTNVMVQERLEGLEVGNTMDRVTAALDSLTMLLNNLSQVVNQNQDQLRATLYNFRQAAESLKQLARSLREEPSRLLFEDRPKPRELP